MNRLGVCFMGTPSVPEMVAIARRAEELGYESAWVAETRITRDALVPLTAIAAATRDLRVGSAVLNVYTRTPMVMAISALALSELAGDRVVLGLGTGSPLILKQQGIAMDRPLARLREYAETVPRLLAGERVDTAGMEGAQLEDVTNVPDGGIPLYLGVTGPRALRLAGECADGVLLNGFMSTGYVSDAARRIAEGAEAAGRAADLEVVALLVVSTDPDAKVAKDRARGLMATYLSLFPNVAEATGLPPKKVAATRKAFFAKGPEAAAATVPDAWVDAHTVAGTPDDCRTRIADYRAAGATNAVICPIDPDPMATVEALAPTPI